MLIKNDDVLKVLGKKIKQSRLSKKYTQEYVAESIDISIDLLRNLENGRNIGSVPTLLNLCNFLNISPNFLFSELLTFKEDTLDTFLSSTIKSISNDDKELLKQYMLFAGVNASQLAEEIEVSKQYILNLRNGQFKVSAIFAKKLEKVNKEAYDLIFGTSRDYDSIMDKIQQSELCQKLYAILEPISRGIETAPVIGNLVRFIDGLGTDKELTEKNESLVKENIALKTELENSENENTKLKAKLFDMSENLATYMMDNTELKKKVYELQKEINSIEESR